MTLNLYLIRLLPDFLWPVKKWMIKNSLKKAGSCLRFGPNTTIVHPEQVSIGNNVFLSDGAYISSIVPLSIGNNVMFGPQVMLLGGDHNISEVGKPMIDVKEGGENLSISIEDDCWLGARSMVLKGVTIAEGSVIAAGSTLLKSNLPYSINAGVPSKHIRCRFDKESLVRHLDLVKSRYRIDQIIELYEQNGFGI